MIQHAHFFKVCRRALDMSVREMQDALALRDERTIRRIETGEIAVQGPTWIAVGVLLRDAGEGDLADRVEGILATMREQNTSCEVRADRL